MTSRGKPGDGARMASRLGGDYLLRSLNLLSQLADSQMVTAVVSLAITQANVAHLIGKEGEAYADLDSVPPDSVRRPVSVLALSASLGLPYETTRRHVEILIKAGQCVRVKGGVITPADVVDLPLNREMLKTNLTNLRRLFRGLKAAGIDL